MSFSVTSLHRKARRQLVGSQYVYDRTLDWSANAQDATRILESALQNGIVPPQDPESLLRLFRQPGDNLCAPTTDNLMQRLAQEDLQILGPLDQAGLRTLPARADGKEYTQAEIFAAIAQAAELLDTRAFPDGTPHETPVQHIKELGLLYGEPESPKTFMGYQKWPAWVNAHSPLATDVEKGIEAGGHCFFVLGSKIYKGVEHLIYFEPLEGRILAKPSAEFKPKPWEIQDGQRVEKFSVIPAVRGKNYPQYFELLVKTNPANIDRQAHIVPSTYQRSWEARALYLDKLDLAVTALQGIRAIENGLKTLGEKLSAARSINPTTTAWNMPQTVLAHQ